MRLAISTCPNDTFAFHGLITGKIDRRGLDFEIELLDIQQLNDGLLAGDFEVAKASFHAAVRLSDSTVVLPSGSALGFGVGPLLLAAKSSEPENWQSDRPSRVLCPGSLTTATMLLQLFYGHLIAAERMQVEQVLFSDIMPALESGSADFGVCIHEGRFTWQPQGLHCVEDLGTRWEQETGGPLPLGGILASRSLPRETIHRVQAVIRESIDYGLANREETVTTMRKYAQEFEDEVLFQHVDLYVNQWTVDLGPTGRHALQELARRAVESGLVSEGTLEVWGSDPGTQL